MYVIRRQEGEDITYLDSKGKFTTEISQAQQYPHVELAIKALKGYQSEGDTYYDICVFASPETVRNMGNIPPLPPKDIRALTGLSQQRFGDFYGIPKRTIEAWEMGERTAPEWVMKLLERAVREDLAKGLFSK